MSKQKSFSMTDQPLGSADFYILLSLSAKERHGYEIMKQVGADSKNKINLGPGTLYSAIKRLLKEGLIEMSNQDKRRKYYKITVKGLGILNVELQRFESVLALAKRYKVKTKAALSYEFVG